MVLGEKEQVLYGRGYIEDVLCGRRFRISSKSFYQVNAVQTEKLYGRALEYAALTGKETVIDAYCGIGTIGLAAAAHAKKVIGVELNQAAVKDAVEHGGFYGSGFASESGKDRLYFLYSGDTGAGSDVFDRQRPGGEGEW